MAQKCEHQKSDGVQCRAYARTGTERCHLHTFTPKLEADLRKGGQRRAAQRKLLATQKQFEKAVPGAITKFGLTSSQVAKLRDVEGLMAWSEYCSGLILRHEISAPEGQALAAFTRIAKELISLQTEIRLIDLETIDVEGAEA